MNRTPAPRAALGKLIVALIALSTAACPSPRAADPAPAAPAAEATGGAMPSPAPDAFARVEAHAGPGAAVQRVDAGLDGLELFRITRRPAGANAPEVGTGAAVIAGRDGVLGAADAMRAVVERAGKSEPDRLARLALALLIPRSGTPEPGARLDGDALVFRWRVDGPGRGLMQTTLDLGTMKAQSGPAPTEVDAVAGAIAGLGDPSDMTRQAAITTLTDHCTDPRVAPALGEAMKTHADVATRAQAAEAAGRCREVPVADLAALLGGADPAVRIGAAAGLGHRGTSEAEQALRDAAPAQTDAAVKQAIGRAVKRIMTSRGQ